MVLVGWLQPLPPPRAWAIPVDPSGVSKEVDGDPGMQEETRTVVGMLSLEIMTQIIWEDTKILCKLSYIFFSLGKMWWDGLI